MQQFNFFMGNMRFHLKKPDVFLFFCAFREDNPQEYQIKVCVDGQPQAYTSQVEKGIEVRQRYIRFAANITEEICGQITFTKPVSQIHEITFYGVNATEEILLHRVKGSKIRKLHDRVQECVESATFADGKLTIAGWALGNDLVDLAIQQGGKNLPVRLERTFRKDVHSTYQEIADNYQPGFVIETDMPVKKPVNLVFAVDGKKQTERISKNRNVAFRSPVEKTMNWLRDYGFSITAARVFKELEDKFHHSDQPSKVDYRMWRRKYAPTKAEIQAQYGCHFDYEPKFSIVIPLYDTKPRFLRELIDSIQKQTYTNWELCLADGTGEQTPLKAIVEDYQSKDARIRYEILKENKGISENTNAAIKMATGDFIVLADHDDIVPAEALYECVKAINKDMTIDVIYSDEDKIDMDGKKYFDPHFKSDYNVDLLCCMNYICHLFVVKKSIVDEVGMLRSEFDGAQDHDFIFRCCEAAQKICHIPKILYHWRCHINSTAINPESKMYAYEAGRKAVQEHYDRMGIPAKVEHAAFYGMYKTIYQWKEQPLISIIIPNKDHIEDLQKCMDSIDQKSTYRNYEFVIVENNSTEQKTFDFYKSIENRDNVQVLYYKGGFNFSTINNFGAAMAKGDYYLLLNNDTEIINPDCLWEMLGYCMRSEVGIVGARLFYPDDTIQHAGVVLGFGGMAGHTFIGCSRYDNGYFSRIICAQDYSAVTAACMMTKKSVFWEVGGLTESFEVAFNDIDYCMKVRKAGYLVVYNPAAELYHYESKSRGMEDTPEKVARFNSEVNRFLEQWDKELKAGDPYYNPNLSLNRSDFGLRE